MFDIDQIDPDNLHDLLWMQANVMQLRFILLLVRYMMD